MDMQNLLNSKTTGVIALKVSRLLPPSAGYKLAGLLAGWVAKKKHLPMVQAIRANQWVLHGCDLSGDELDQLAEKVLTNMAISFYDLFRNIAFPSRLQKLVAYTPEADTLIENSKTGDFGVVVAGIHCAGFDFVLQAASLRGLKGLALSLPQTNEGIEWQHQLRQKSGVEVLPASIKNLRATIARLENGGVVLTGVERPMDQVKMRPMFFGKPAAIPVHYAQLALKAQVPIVVMTGIRRDDGIYQVISSEYMQIEEHSNHREAIRINVEKVVAFTENVLKKYPDHWAIHQPVWPDLLSRVPA